MNDNSFDSGANSDRIRKLDCAEVTDSLGDYVENDLPPPVKEAVDNHIAKCPACAEFFQSYKQVISSAAELREPEQPLEVDVQNRLRKALNVRLGLQLPYIA